MPESGMLGIFPHELRRFPDIPSKCVFISYFTRDCSDLEDLTNTKCFALESMYPTGTQLLISLLDYIKPGTLRGPDFVPINISQSLVHRPTLDAPLQTFVTTNR